MRRSPSPCAHRRGVRGRRVIATTDTELLGGSDEGDRHGHDGVWTGTLNVGHCTTNTATWRLQLLLYDGNPDYESAITVYETEDLAALGWRHRIRVTAGDHERPWVDLPSRLRPGGLIRMTFNEAVQGIDRANASVHRIRSDASLGRTTPGGGGAPTASGLPRSAVRDRCGKRGSGRATHSVVAPHTRSHSTPTLSGDNRPRRQSTAPDPAASAGQPVIRRTSAPSATADFLFRPYAWAGRRRSRRRGVQRRGPTPGGGHRLVLSAKTVSYHLGNAYTRRDVQSRTHFRPPSVRRCVTGRAEWNPGIRPRRTVSAAA